MIIQTVVVSAAECLSNGYSYCRYLKRKKCFRKFAKTYFIPNFGYMRHEKIEKKFSRTKCGCSWQSSLSFPEPKNATCYYTENIDYWIHQSTCQAFRAGVVVVGGVECYHVTHWSFHQADARREGGTTQWGGERETRRHPLHIHRQTDCVNKQQSVSHESYYVIITLQLLNSTCQ